VIPYPKMYCFSQTLKCQYNSITLIKPNVALAPHFSSFIEPAMFFFCCWCFFFYIHTRSPDQHVLLFYGVGVRWSQTKTRCQAIGCSDDSKSPFSEGFTNWNTAQRKQRPSFKKKSRCPAAIQSPLSIRHETGRH